MPAKAKASKAMPPSVLALFTKTSPQCAKVPLLVGISIKNERKISFSKVFVIWGGREESVMDDKLIETTAAQPSGSALLTLLLMGMWESIVYMAAFSVGTTGEAPLRPPPAAITISDAITTANLIRIDGLYRKKAERNTTKKPIEMPQKSRTARWNMKKNLCLAL